MIGVAGIGVGLALAYAAKHSNLPPPREVMNELFARIHAEYAPSASSKAQAPQHKADRRTRVERLLDEDLEEEEMEMGADYAYTPSMYAAIPITSPTFPLPPPLAFRALSYLDFAELTKALSVNRAFAQFARAMRKDRAYLHGCAERGFGDGITGLQRGRIWQILCGADQLMASMAYAKQGDRSMYWDIVEQVHQPTAAAEVAVNRDAIAKDINRTIVHLDAFTNREDAAEALSNVLNAYAISDPEVGYTQGMNFTAGFLLTKMPQEEAYWCLHALMFSFKYDLRRFYLQSLQGLLIFKHQFNALFAAFLPALYQHFQQQQVYSDVMTEWWMSCFCFKGFPRASLNRVWDWLMLDGQKTMHRVSLAILKLSEETLLMYDFEAIVYYLKNLPDEGVLQPDLLMGTALTFTITNRMLRGMERSYFEGVEKAEEEEQKEKEQRRRDDEKKDRMERHHLFPLHH